MPYYYLESYGCAANEFDSRLLEAQLNRIGFKKVDDPSRADVLFINTCIVKKTTEDRMRSRIKSLSMIGKPLIVTGCMAEALPQLIEKINPSASILGLHRYDELSSIINDVLSGRRIVKTGKKFVDKPTLISDNDTLSKGSVFPIMISQGCLGSCSFCITKFARGYHKSFPMESILNAIKKAIKHGAIEIRLTGQDLGPYGIDIGTNLVELLERICEIEGNFMVRVGMASPDTIDPILDEVIDVMKNCEKIYNFIHLPVQSGSDRVLRLMRRNYSADLFVEQVKRIRRKMGNEISIATDIIVAFPGETEEDHEQTLDLLRRTKPDMVNISRYGDRPMTYASKIYPKIHSGVAKRRSSEVFRLVREISLSHNKRYLGRIVEVLYLGSEGKRVLGRTRNYKLVYSDLSNVDNEIMGKWYQTKINEVTWKVLYGDIIFEEETSKELSVVVGELKQEL